MRPCEVLYYGDNQMRGRGILVDENTSTLNLLKNNYKKTLQKGIIRSPDVSLTEHFTFVS